MKTTAHKNEKIVRSAIIMAAIKSLSDALETHNHHCSHYCWVACHNCFTAGPVAGTEDDAIRYWNKREGDRQPVPPETVSVKGVEGKTITLTKPEIDHLLGLLQTNERTQEYIRMSEQDWKRHHRIKDKLLSA